MGYDHSRLMYTADDFRLLESCLAEIEGVTAEPMDVAYRPAWTGFDYELARPRCPHCGKSDRFRPPGAWYALPPEKILLLRCGLCELDTITHVEALRTNVEETFLKHHGYEKIGTSHDRAYEAFVMGMFLGGVGTFLLLFV